MRYLAFLLMGLVSLPASALTQVNLYQSEIVIDQTQDNADATARSQGMQQVIVRATGDKNAASNEVVQKALRQYNSYLNQFSYGQSDDASTITMQFSAPQIRSLITQAQLPFWPANRSNILVWLVEDSNYEKAVSWEHSDSELLKQLKSEAAVRGLPITVPVGDLDDVTDLQISDLWGGFVAPISAASKRYPTDAVLVVRAEGNDLRWSLYDQNAQAMEQSEKAPLAGKDSGSTAAADMIDQISDYYAHKNALMVNAESAQSVPAEFGSVQNAEDFFNLENRLKGLSSVASLDVLKIQGNSVTFDVHLLATEDEFEQEVVRMSQVQKVEVVAPAVVEAPLVSSEPQVVASQDGTVADVNIAEPVVQQPTTTDLNASQPVKTVSSMTTNPSVTPESPVIVVPQVNTLHFKWLG